MDKIREEFEQIKPALVEDFLQDKDNVNLMFTGYKAGVKSRDEEHEDRKLECIDYQETIIKQQAAIRKLRKVLEEIHETTRHGFNALFAAKISEKALEVYNNIKGE